MIQKIEVTGKVVDANGEPIIGATIKEQGTSNGAISDIDGNFSFETADNANLEVSYIGYQNRKIKVQKGKVLAITLQEDTEMLDEVVVVGYGTVKKANVVGSIAKINSDVIQDRPVGRAEQALQGQMAGVSVRSTSGAPGSDITINVRGAASINGESTPLYVVDGVPIDNLSGINPNDIESIEVLKDASSTAIYGSSGANGVILITTKQGKSGKTQIDYNGYVGAQTILNQLDFWDGPEYAEYTREAYRNTSNSAIRYNSDVASRDQDLVCPGFTRDPSIMESVMMGWGEDGVYNPSRVRTTRYMDHVTRTGMVTDHQLSIRGGGERTNFLASATYNKNNGIFKDEDYERYSIRLNLNHEINKYVKIGAQTQYSACHSAARAGLAGGWRLSPLAQLWDENGEIIPLPGSYNVYNTMMDLVPGAVDRPLKTTRYLGSYSLGHQTAGRRFEVPFELGY